MSKAEKKVGFITMGEATKEPHKARDIGIGMMGYAFMGKAHSLAWARMPVVFYPPPAWPNLIAIFGRTKDKVTEAANRYGYRKAYTDWRELIKDKDVEVVDNGLPNNLHKAPCIEAVENGKHVICEKPLALNSSEAKAMLRAAERAKVKHMTAFNYRFVPAIQLARQLVTDGFIGKVLQYRAVYLQEWIMNPEFPLVWRLRKEVAGSGALGDLGAHILDLARFLVDEITEVCGMTKTFIEERPLPDDSKKRGKVDVDDAFISMLKFKGGAIGSVEASRFCAGRKNYQRLELHGTEGSIAFDLERLNELELFSTRDRGDIAGFRRILVTEAVHPYYDKWWPHGHIIGWEHAMVHEVFHLVNCIVDDKEVSPIGATFFDGLRNNVIMDAIQRSALEGRWVTVD